MKSPFDRGVVFLHTGHIGDIVAFLPIYQRIGGTFLMIKDDAGMCPMKGYKYDSLKPLLESQGIKVDFNTGATSVDFDMTNWRECYEDNISLMDSQARYVGLIPRQNSTLVINEPWIKVDADPNTKGRVIFNRSPRYNNPKFPWKEVWQHFGDRALFTGTEQEYKNFYRMIGKVEYYETPSCLEVAQAIEGADYFVGNQSSSFWIAAALRKPLLQEVFEPSPNSIIPYKGATYCRGGSIDFSKL